MPRVNFFSLDGERHELDVKAGQSLMEAAIDNNIGGIVAECGGACACATCHAYVAGAWVDRLPAANEMEDALLDAVTERRANSRLTCQIEMSDELDGIEIHAADNEN